MAYLFHRVEVEYPFGRNAVHDGRLPFLIAIAGDASVEGSHDVAETEITDETLGDAVGREPLELRGEFRRHVFEAVEELEAAAFEIQARHQVTAELDITLLEEDARIVWIFMRLIIVG